MHLDFQTALSITCETDADTRLMQSMAGARHTKYTNQWHLELDFLPALVDLLIEHKLGASVSDAVLPAVQARLEALRQTERNVAERLPLGMELFPFQLAGAQFLETTPYALLCDQMGLGKTIEVLAAIPHNAAVQIICPVSLLGNWQREIERWRPDLQTLVSKKWLGTVPGTVTISSYTGHGEAELANYYAHADSILVLDEAHYAKALHAHRTKAVHRLIEENDWAKVWALTGTPILNRPPELWSMLALIRRAEEIFGSIGRFNAFFGYRFDGFRAVWNDPSPEVVQRLAPALLHRKRKDVLPDLPAKRWEIVTMAAEDLDASTMQALESAELALELESIFEESDDGSISMRAQAHLSQARKALAAAKLGKVLEIAEQYEDDDEPLVVFSAHRLPIDTLGKRDGWTTITGSTDPIERQTRVEEFQRGRWKGIACTIAAAGVGLTLTHASHVLMIDPSWTPAENEQATDRVCRIGQTRGVVIKCLVAEHNVDKLIWEKLVLKQRLIDAVMVHQAERAMPLTGRLAKVVSLLEGAHA